MSIIRTDNQHYYNIANAIRDKLNVETTYEPSEMAAAVRSIIGGGGVEALVEYNGINSEVSDYITRTNTAGATEYTLTNYKVVGSTPAVTDVTSSMLNNDFPLTSTLSIPENASKIYWIDETTAKSWDQVVTPDTTFSVQNLIPTHKYFYYILDSSDNHLKSGYYKQTGQLRMIKMNTIRNVRDIGGWVCNGGTVKYGLIYRGGTLTWASGGVEVLLPTGSPTLQAENRFQLHDVCGIRCEIDMRSPDTVVNNYSSLGSDVEYLYLPLVDGAYANNLYVENTYKIVKKVIQNVIYGIPTYLHCSAGADRTGTIIFLLEGLLGLNRIDADRDYELTSCYSARYRTNLTNNYYPELVDAVNSIVLPGTTADTYENHCIQWAIKSAGITVDTLNKFREAMIDGSPTPINAANFETSVSVSYQLTDVISSNTSATTHISQPYNTSLTPDNSGGNKIINSVEVYMGDATNIADQVWSGVETDYAVYVTETLVGCTTDCPRTLLASKSATISVVANTGYTLTGATIAITMGGTDISNSYDTNTNTITISSVTGALVISISAVAL